jgi:hypothetical protein
MFPRRRDYSAARRQSTAASRAGCDHADADGSPNLGVLYRDTGRLADADKAFSEAADHLPRDITAALRTFRTA